MLSFTKPAAPSARERQLEAENRDLRDQLAALTDRLAGLQTANERMYAADYDATGGPRFDRKQTFPHQPERPRQSWGLKGGTA